MKGFLRKWNEISLIKRIVCGLAVGAVLALLLPVVFLPLVCHVAYTLGLHQFSVSDKLFYKNKPRKKKTSPRR